MNSKITELDVTGLPEFENTSSHFVSKGFTGKCVASGYLFFYVNGKKHRLDGPAQMLIKQRDLYPNADEYWINGIWYSKHFDSSLSQYWNHPLVLEYKMQKITNHVDL